MSRPRDLPKPGTTIGRYVIDERVAAGGMGVVFRGRVRGAHGFERKVAIKTIHPSLVASEAHRTRFLNEARLAATIHHDNVAEVLDVCDEGGLLFLVLEWIDGMSARQLLLNADASGGSIPLPIVVRIVLDVLEGLHHAHELATSDGRPLILVHRDVSPENIIVSEQGKAKVIDFGIAKAQDGFGPHTATGQVLGKTPFIAPEQARAASLDRRADIWAVGAVLRLLATKTHAHTAPSQVEHLYMLALGQEPDPLADDSPPWLRQILKSAMAVDLEERFPTCAAFADALVAAGVEIAQPATVAAYVRNLRPPSIPKPGPDTAPMPEPNVTAHETSRSGAGRDDVAITTEPTSAFPSERGERSIAPRDGHDSLEVRPSSRARRIAAFTFGLVVILAGVLALKAHDDAPAPAPASTTPVSAERAAPLPSPAPVVAPTTSETKESLDPVPLQKKPGPLSTVDRGRPTSPRSSTPRPSERRPSAAPSFNDYGF